MAELDKKSESSGEQESGAVPNADEDDVTDVPRRARKPEKVRSRERHHKKNPAKIAAAPGAGTLGDGGRLRSAR